VPYAVARKKVLAATESVSKGGLNPIPDGLQLDMARDKAAALFFGEEFEEVYDNVESIVACWLHMKFVAEHPEATGPKVKNHGDQFNRWLDKRVATAAGAGN
jgi:hypothetical protein